jgi:5-methyltetrahydrofolate--homocysteine methyltransferase
MKKIMDILGKKVIIGDGSMGALLESRLSGPFIPDELNLSNPELIRDIHREYARAGADFITTNTFGASPLKLREISLEKRFGAINREAVRIARSIAEKNRIWVAGNLGPCGKLIEPLGEMEFSQVRQNFSRQARELEKAGADFILIETITEIQEFRAAVVGALSTVRIPVMASMSFVNDDLSLSGTDGSVFAVTSGFPGLTAVGSNCGNSLENMNKAMKKIADFSILPILCQPNAGLPVVEKGKTVFKVKAGEFADFMEDIYRLGTSIVGSCCGSDPDFTRELARRFKRRPVFKRKLPPDLILTTRSGMKPVSNDKIFLVGERINPTGRKILRRELESGRLTTVKYDARQQEKAGSDALDINLNIHQLDKGIVCNIIKSVQNMVDIPLFIDSTDPEIVEEFCRLYPGKGVINSISGERKSMKNLLPLAKTYNQAFVAALIDDQGIADSPDRRCSVARKIVRASEKLGIPRKNIIFDPLVLSAGAEISKVRVTLDTLELLKKEFPDNKTIIGLSNISFGLPNRELVNAVFLSLAASRGLDMVIANPLQQSLRDHLIVTNFLSSGSEKYLSRFIETFSGFEKKAADQLHAGSDSLYDNILEGDSDSARENIGKLLGKSSSMDVIGSIIVPAMNEVGNRYQRKDFFLPQLIAAADVVKAVLPAIKEKLAGSRQSGGTTVMLATVKGDIHDIGKNIIVSILESFNYTVIDLGKDVAAERIIAEAEKFRPDVIGLSTLMTTTIPEMLATVELIKTREILKAVKLFIGGAVVNRKMADRAGVHYARDGIELVKKLKSL